MVLGCLDGLDSLDSLANLDSTIHRAPPDPQRQRSTASFKRGPRELRERVGRAEALGAF